METDGCGNDADAFELYSGSECTHSRSDYRNRDQDEFELYTGSEVSRSRSDYRDQCDDLDSEEPPDGEEEQDLAGISSMQHNFKKKNPPLPTVGTPQPKSQLTWLLAWSLRRGFP